MIKNSLDGKIALVTGGSRGIGAAVARQLASQGARVIVNYRENAAAADRVVGDIAAAGGEAFARPFDVSCPEATQSAFKELIREFGALHVLVNNAGITADALLPRISFEDWQRILNTNLTSVFLCCKWAVRTMIKQRWGRIINISSVTAESGNAGQSNYAAAKAGILGFTKSLALELASREITVNAVTPGFIETDMTSGLPEEVKRETLHRIPLGRMGCPEDVAYAVGFLAGQGAGYITGQVLRVNGGLYT